MLAGRNQGQQRNRQSESFNTMAQIEDKPPDNPPPASNEPGTLNEQVEALLEKNESIRRESAETMQRTKELLQRIEAHRQ
jgi:hypothetical protein